jgi:hypothetical protein
MARERAGGPAPVAAARFSSQLLGPERAADPVAVADRLLAVQAQDLRSARIAVRARTSGLTSDDVDRALSDDRTLVVGWLNRGTLHLVRHEDYWWLHALTTPPLATGNARRLAQTGVSPRAVERGVAAIVRALAGEGPLTRDRLRDRVRKAGVPTEGQALVHLLMAACLRGLAVRGPVVGKHHAYVLARDWLGPAPVIDRDRSLAELARRYLAGHAPADERDLAKWAGLPLRDARTGLATIARSVVHRPDGLLELEGRDRAGMPRPLLLDQWDPVLVGWRSRELLLRDYPRLDSAEAHFRPFAYVDGRAVGIWSMRRQVVGIELFARLARARLADLNADAADLVRFFTGAGQSSRRR